MARTITFLSDYGHGDEFVGVVHGVIARECPDARVIDLGHGVPARDVRAGALMLARALPFVPAGVHLAVVDPGVGGARRAVALRTAHEGRLLVGPDNGLLAPAAQAFGGAAQAVEISRSPWRLEPVSATFHGRDLFAPVAARLAGGAPLEQAGAPLDPGELAPLALPDVRREGGALIFEVLAVDAYGNLQLAPGGLAAASLRLGHAVAVESSGAPAGPGAVGAVAGAAAASVGAAAAAGASAAVRAWAHCGRTFADVEAGALLAYEDAGGMLALAVNGGSAAALLGVGPGDELRLRAT